MFVVIDLSFLDVEQGETIPTIFRFFGTWWWIFAIVLVLWIAWEIYVSRNKSRYFDSLEYVLLAIDIPKENEQNVKAVEQIFAALHAVEKNLSFYKRNILGKIQDRFSLEIVSIDGHVQFLIRTQVEFRDLVESAIYSQYSDAVITEVADYTNIDVTFPSEEYELWGTRFKFYNKNPYPIRTHIFFEYGLQQVFVDPMASILETMSKLRRGEQIWLQLVISPENEKWVEEGRGIVSKLIDEKVKTKSRLGPVTDIALGTYETVTASLAYDEKVESKNQDEQKNKMQQLTPGQRSVVESIEVKLAKLAFRVKFRMIYIAEKGVYSKQRGVISVIGGLKQFNTLDLNGFTTDKGTKTDVKFLFKKRRLAARQRRILSAYRRREPGERGIIMNIEELATLYHFPLLTVKAPYVQMTDARRSKPPVELPLEKTPFGQTIPTRETSPAHQAPPPAATPVESSEKFTPQPAAPPEHPSEERKDQAPSNLPFVQ